jgi:hypothetical protein
MEDLSVIPYSIALAAHMNTVSLFYTSFSSAGLIKCRKPAHFDTFQFGPDLLFAGVSEDTVPVPAYCWRGSTDSLCQ